jgi:hypothetical protein
MNIMPVNWGSNPFPCIFFPLDKGLNNEGYFNFLIEARK